MNRIQEWIVFLAALLLLTNAAFDAALADHDEHREKRWYQKIFDWDDDDVDYQRICHRAGTAIAIE